MKREIRILFYIWSLNDGKTAFAVFPLFLPFIVIYMKKILMKQTSIPLHMKNFRVKILSVNKTIKYSLKIWRGEEAYAG